MGEIGAGSGTSYPGSLDTDSTVEVDSPSGSKTLVRAATPNDLSAAVVAIETELGTDPAGTLSNVKTYLQTEHNTDGTHKASLVGMLAGTQTFAGDKTFSGTTTFSGVPQVSKASPYLLCKPTANTQGQGLGLYTAAGALVASIDYVNSPDDVFRLVDSNAVASVVEWIRTTGVQSKGTVPLARMKRTEVASKNSGTVTLTSSSLTITTIDLGTVNSGDRIFVSSFVSTAKGGTAGRNTVSIAKDSGTATITTCQDATGLTTSFHSIASESWNAAVSGMINVTGTGTLVLKMTGVSIGSDSDVTAGNGQLIGLVLNNG